MEKIVKEAKTLEECLDVLEKELNVDKDNILYTKENIKGKLFKSDSVQVTVYLKEDIFIYIKEYLTDICKGLGLEVSFEIKTKDSRTTIKMFSSNNSILIGKNGQTIKSLEILVKQHIYATTGLNFKVTLDVENYRDKKENNLIRLAKQTAKEVSRTKVTTHLENMNSFERRIIHNALTDFKGIKCYSEGMEPNRHIVIESE